MRAIARALAGALVLGLAGCDTPVPNQSALVYPALSGPVQIQWNFDTTGVQEVDYTVDGSAVGSSTDPTTQFKIQLDTSKFANGLHDLKLQALDATKTPVHELENTILIKN